MTAAAPAQAFDFVTFRDEGHEYRIDGSPVFSVTQGLEAVGIIDYSAIPEKQREFALRRGQLVHIATHYDDEGDLRESSVHPVVKPYLTAYRNWRADSGFVPMTNEEIIGCRKFRYAGRRDKTGYFRHDPDTPVIVDLKTGHAEWWVKLQLAAYVGVEKEPRKWRRIGLELHDDGTYRVYEFPASRWFAHYNTFLAALSVAYELRDHSYA